MGKILDLSVFQEETLDIKTADGQVLNIPKPSQKMVIELMKFKTIDENSEPAKVVDALDRMSGLILNSNTNGIKFEKSSIVALSMDAKAAILKAYAEFAAGLQSDPT